MIGRQKLCKKSHRLWSYWLFICGTGEVLQWTNSQCIKISHTKGYVKAWGPCSWKFLFEWFWIWIWRFFYWFSCPHFLQGTQHLFFFLYFGVEQHKTLIWKKDSVSTEIPCVMYHNAAWVIFLFFFPFYIWPIVLQPQYALCELNTDTRLDIRVWMTRYCYNLQYFGCCVSHSNSHWPSYMRWDFTWAIFVWNDFYVPLSLQWIYWITDPILNQVPYFIYIL